MKNKISVLLLFLFLIPLVQLGSTNWSNASKEDIVNIVEQARKKFHELSSFSMEVSYTSFENYSSSKPYETSKGYFKKEGENYHSYLMETHTIQNSKIKLVINPESKQIMICSPTKALEPAIELDSLLDRADLFKSFKVRNTEKEKNIRIEFFEKYTYQAIEETISAEGILTKVIFYYNKFSAQENWKSKPKDYMPRLEITFTDIKNGAKFSYEKEFDEKKYILKNATAFKPTKEYEGYDVFDTRINNTK